MVDLRCFSMTPSELKEYIVAVASKIWELDWKRKFKNCIQCRIKNNFPKTYLDKNEHVYVEKLLFILIVMSTLQSFAKFFGKN